MKLISLISIFIGGAVLVRAEIIEFALSPPGTTPGVGLHPANEVIPGSSSGSGNEIGSGIFFDTSTRLLTLHLAYGSAFGFSDLTGPAFAWLLHGPALDGETAPAVFNLQSLHNFAINPALGGEITGAIALDESQETSLLRGWSYINIYTPENLGGELRGQLVVVPEPTVMTLLLGIGASTLLWRLAGNHRRNALR